MKENQRKKSNKKGDKTLSCAVHNLYEQMGGKILSRRDWEQLIQHCRTENSAV